MTLICPICHSRNSVEAAILTEAGRAYTRLLLNQGDALRYPLARYILLFAPAGREMAYDRRLRLVEETLALDADPRRLAAALATTVEAIMAKRAAGDVRPLTKHNYLLSVLASTAPPPGPLLSQEGVQDRAGAVAPKGKRRQAIELLAAWAGADWLRVEIAQGLQALCALPHLTPPGADAIELTAGVYETVIRRRVNIPEVDAGRVTCAFSELLKNSLKDWPDPAEVLAQLPRRPERVKITEHNPDDVAAGREFFKAMKQTL